MRAAARAAVSGVASEASILASRWSLCGQGLGGDGLMRELCRLLAMMVFLLPDIGHKTFMIIILNGKHARASTPLKQRRAMSARLVSRFSLGAAHCGDKITRQGCPE